MQQSILRVIQVASGFTILLASIAIGLEGGLLANAPTGALLQTATWRIGTDTTLGTSVAVTITSLIIMVLSLSRMPKRGASSLALAPAVFAVGGLALTGHAGTAHPRWLAAPALTLHVMAVAFWIGSLWSLLLVLRSADGPAAAPIVRRVSHRAVPIVATSSCR
jgi:copper transport protein